MKPGNPRIDFRFVGCQFPQRILEDENVSYSPSFPEGLFYLRR